MQISEDFGFCFLAIVYSTSVPFIIPLPHHYKIILSRKGSCAVHTYLQYLPYSPIRELFTDGMYCTYLLPTPWIVCTCCKNIRCRIYSRYISYIAIWLPKAEVRHSLPLSWEGTFHTLPTCALLQPYALSYSLSSVLNGRSFKRRCQWVLDAYIYYTHLKENSSKENSMFYYYSILIP